MQGPADDRMSVLRGLGRVCLGSKFKGSEVSSCVRVYIQGFTLEGTRYCWGRFLGTGLLL